MDEIVDTIAGRSFRRTEHVGCPLCGSTSSPRQIAARFGMTAMVAECPACRLAYQTPRPSREACIAYMDWRWASADKYVTDNPRKRQRSQEQLAIVHQCQRPPGRLLDFGAGSGTFVRAALDAGWDAIGVEHSPAAVARARQLYGVDLLTEPASGTYDIVTLWDVVEHLKEPVAVLSQLAACLRPGGSVIVETGNYESWMRVARGDTWGLYLFDHHYYFSPASLDETLERAGFTSARLVPGRRRRPSLRQIAHWRTVRDCRSAWPEHADIGVMVMTARKPG